MLTPRAFPGVASFGDNKIAIIGGFHFDEVGDQTMMGDVILFDTNVLSAEKPVRDLPGLLQFCSIGNQAFCIEGNTIAILSMDSD